MNKKNRILLMVSITLFTLSILSFGTYALWTSTDILTDNNTIQSGQVKMSYTESNEIGMNNALPIKDSEGKVLTNYFDFKVLSYIKTKANDNTKRKLNYNIVLEPITVNNPLSDNEMKVYLTKIVDGVEEQVVEPTTIDKLNKYILKSQEEIFSNNKAEVVTSYRLRAWIDQDVDTNKLNEKSYSYKFRVNVNNDTTNSGGGSNPSGGTDGSGANAPTLLSNMIPVYYDETDSVWKKADSNNDNGSWYNYNNKMWANAVTVSETNRETYLSAKVGTEVSMDEINTMWVWIPRYTYTYLNTNTPQEIKIKFESGTNSSGTISCVDDINKEIGAATRVSETCTDNANNELIAGTSTYTHPAFWWDKNDDKIRTSDEELTGIWVGKFQVSSDLTCTAGNGNSVGYGCNNRSIRPLIKPNVTSWRGAMVGTFFNGIYNMKEENNRYGFTDADEVHMIKNMEWGAVTYLSHSKYGINKQITVNTTSTYTTGCGPQSEDLTIYGEICNAYNSTLGQTVSTTGNVSGIYDMGGGGYSAVMGASSYTEGSLMVGRSNTVPNVENSGFAGVMSLGKRNSGPYSLPSKRYYDQYSYSTGSSDYVRGKLGDATKEMAPIATSNKGGWYGGIASLPGYSTSWFVRGGSYQSGTEDSPFSFISLTGGSIISMSTFAVISIVE